MVFREQGGFYKGMPIPEFNALVVKGIDEYPERQDWLVQLARFYELVLACKREAPSDCTHEQVERSFGKEIMNFWYSYHGYIEQLRSKGHPSLAKQIEAYANIRRTAKAATVGQGELS